MDWSIHANRTKYCSFRRVFEPPPPVNRRTPIVKTLPSHYTSYVHGNDVLHLNNNVKNIRLS